MAGQQLLNVLLLTLLSLIPISNISMSVSNRRCWPLAFRNSMGLQVDNNMLTIIYYFMRLRAIRRVNASYRHTETRGVMSEAQSVTVIVIPETGDWSCLTRASMQTRDRQ